MSISVLGAGAWGTALASMLASYHENVSLWGRNSDTLATIDTKRRNPIYLGDIPLNDGLRTTEDISVACAVDTILCVTPAQSFADLCREIVPHVASHTNIVLCAKGINRSDGRFLHQIANDYFDHERVFALSGPSFASDVARNLPTAVSLAGPNLKSAHMLAAQLSGSRFRIYASDDLIGVEAGGALKNVLAIAVGVARGLGLGASAEAALVARGFAELNRLSQCFGAKAETLAGLSGLGDLVLTCSSPQSRNFSYGIALANGEDLSNQPLAEGAFTASVALDLARKHKIEVPIIETVTAVLNGDIVAAKAVTHLLDRPLRNEV